MPKNVYLDTMTIEEAYSCLFKSLNLNALRKTEKCHVSKLLGRVTSEAVFAAVSNPHYNAAAMDGIVVKSVDLMGVDERHPKCLHVDSDYRVVDTGDVIPEGFDSVIMVEDVVFISETQAEVREATYPNEHVRLIGEDIVVGEMLLTTGHTIRPVDLGALISGGIEMVSVYTKPKVGLIPTGTEIVVPGTVLKPGDIIDSNSYVFSAMVEEAGGLPTSYLPVIDDEGLLRAAILKAVDENDLVVINAGSSAGREDFTAGLIGELGTLLVHGLSIKPGRPTILGHIKGKPVIGVPGYPVSAYVVFTAFVDPLIRLMAVKDHSAGATAMVTLTKRIVSSLKNEEFVRMKLGVVGHRLVGTPLSRGAGTTMSLVKADGLLTVPRTREGYEAGEQVEVALWQSREKLDQTLVIIGSHDILIDYVQDALIRDAGSLDGASTHELSLTVSSAHVGSLGGIMAIKRGEAHLAPIHLLDPVSGSYNMASLNKYLSGIPLYVIKGIKRQQGLYVLKGNPLNIENLSDVAAKGLVFANRQKGSGTRVLLDYLLDQQGVSAEVVKGYEQELLTHTSVALAVLSGNAQVGMGIESVARLMGLDFIPVGEEDYDFIIPKAYFQEAKVQTFIRYLGSEAFAELLQSLGGYRLEPIQIILHEEA